MSDTINVLSLDSVTEMQEGDVLLLVRGNAAYQVDFSRFKGEKGDQGTTGQLDDVSVERNRLIATLSE